MMALALIKTNTIAFYNFYLTLAPPMFSHVQNCLIVLEFLLFRYKFTWKVNDTIVDTALVYI